MFGAFDFSKTAKAEGIKPIIGTQMPLMYNKEKNKIGYLFLLHKMKSATKISLQLCVMHKTQSMTRKPIHF